MLRQQQGMEVEPWLAVMLLALEVVQKAKEDEAIRRRRWMVRRAVVRQERDRGRQRTASRDQAWDPGSGVGLCRGSHWQRVKLGRSIAEPRAKRPRRESCCCQGVWP